MYNFKRTIKQFFSFKCDVKFWIIYLPKNVSSTCSDQHFLIIIYTQGSFTILMNHSYYPNDLNGFMCAARMNLIRNLWLCLGLLHTENRENKF